MAKKILIPVVVLLAALAAFIATRPDEFHVQRSATINAPADVVYAQLDDFHAWAAWSPWDKMDPSMKRTFSGAAKGVGAVYGWVGNDKVGEGQMTITDTKPPSHLAVKLDFLKPMAMTNQVDFTLEPAGSGTKVTWAMSGHNNFVSKAFHLVMDMDKMVGGDFEKGLASLGEISETEAKKRAQAPVAAAAPVQAPPAAKH